MDATGWVCWFCAAENDGVTRSCGFCGHNPEDGPAPKATAISSSH